MIRQSDTPDGFLPPRLRDRPRHWGLSRLMGEALRSATHFDRPGSSKRSTVRAEIVAATVAARKGRYRPVAALVQSYRRRWNVSDYCLCAMFWDCAGVQGTELRAWLEEAAR